MSQLSLKKQLYWQGKSVLAVFLPEAAKQELLARLNLDQYLPKYA
jgi:hypothetical protein